MPGHAQVPPRAGSREAQRAAEALRYVVHEHENGDVHFALGLELDGSLVSWTIPKGPSGRPGERRKARRDADRPLRDADFEGTLKCGAQAERVLVWDRGAWCPEGEPHRALSRGKLSFRLEGEKLNGRFQLVRSGGSGKRPEHWQLFKAEEPLDEGAVDLVSECPESVLSGRTIDEVDQPGRAELGRPAPEPVAGMLQLIGQLEPGFPLTDLDRLVFPKQGLRKGALVAYYVSVASLMLPHLRARPLAWLRCPQGAEGRGFWQRRVPKGAPEAIARTDAGREGERPHVLGSVHDLRGILALSQLDVIEVHTWACHVQALERPDLLTFELGPGADLPFAAVVEAALALRAELARWELVCFVQTTGMRGLQVVAPVQRGLTWTQHEAVAHAIVARVAAALPRRYNIAPRPPKPEELCLDARGNRRGIARVSPYSPRATSNASVATPLRWDELARVVAPESFNLRSVLRRLEEQKLDPWRDFFELRQSCPKELVRAAQAAQQRGC